MSPPVLRELRIDGGLGEEARTQERDEDGAQGGRHQDGQDADEEDVVGIIFLVFGIPHGLAHRVEGHWSQGSLP